MMPVWLGGEKMADDKKNAKLYITVTPEFHAHFKKWAGRMGLTLSQMGNICVQSGLNHLIGAVSPLEMLKSDQLITILKSGLEGRQMELLMEEIKKDEKSDIKLKKEG
jgi:hypothetical protein